MAKSPDKKSAADKAPAKQRRSSTHSRPRRNAIDALPVEAAHEVAWVREELLGTRLNQSEIREQLNANLAAMGINKVISASSMSNYAKYIMAQGHEIIHAREMAKVFINDMKARDGLDVELYVGELITAAVAKAMRGIIANEEPDVVALRDAATALYRLARARAASHAVRRTILKEIGDKIEAEGKANGASQDSIDKMKQALGLNVDVSDDEQGG